VLRRGVLLCGTTAVGIAEGGDGGLRALVWRRAEPVGVGLLLLLVVVAEHAGDVRVVFRIAVGFVALSERGVARFGLLEEFQVVGHVCCGCGDGRSVGWGDEGEE